MKGTDGNSGPMTFELTIVGTMGAVLRSAILPHEVTKSEVCTIFRTGTKHKMDAADIVLLLHDEGVSVEGVISLDS